MDLGYACINNTLAEQKVQVNRGMIKKTFAARGIAYASQLALQNLEDLSKVIDWNIAQGLKLYRMSSDMFPWMSEYEFSDMPDIASIRQILSAIGDKASAHQLRLTFHPGPFNVLATLNEEVLRKTLKELRQHGEIMDMIGLPSTVYAKINIHIGGAYGDKQSAMQRFCENFRKLPRCASGRLTVENDDRPNLFSVRDLLYVYEHTGIPLVFDYHHHEFNTGGWTEQEALLQAVRTWPAGIRPVVHFSSSRKRFEDPAAIASSHADYIYEPINLYGQDVDVMLEAKAKEQAILRYRKNHWA